MPKRILIVFFALLIAAGLEARSHKRRSGGDAPGAFDYYLLTLSWAPDFCDVNPTKGNARECGRGNHVGFILHGLWPQYSNGGYPKGPCGPVRPVGSDIVDQMVPVMTAPGLVQHEWADHGTCSGLSPKDYFGAALRAFESVKVPNEFKSMSQQVNISPPDVESKMAAANPSFPRDAFRVGCGDRSGELQDVKVCLSKDLKPISCTITDCPVSQLKMLPPR